jgi:phosphate transport system permease protein
VSQVQQVERQQRPSLTARGRGPMLDRSFKYLTLAAAILVLAILLLILVSTLKQSWPVFRLMGARYFTSDNWSPNDDTFGALALIFGTLLVSLLAIIMAVPVSIGIALFLTELAPRRVRGPVITLIDLLASMPSVVFGLWGILVVAPALHHLYLWFGGLVSGVPLLRSLFGEDLAGRNFATAGLIVAIMILPIITSITREVFATVPDSDKQAALALGATRWEMIKGAVFPHSFGGMVGAVMLGLGRAMGETIAIALVIGASVRITPNLFASGEAMPSIIARQWGEAGGLHQAALIGLGVVLFILTVLINYVARFVVRRAELRMRGAAA